jgi:hypothetical protein
MKITPREAMDLGLWDRICELTGISVWALNEDQINENEEINVIVSKKGD